MNIKQLIRNEIKNNKQNYATCYDILDDMLAKYPQARLSHDKSDGTMKNSTLRREIARALDESSNWTYHSRSDTGRKVYQRVKTKDLSEFTK